LSAIALPARVSAGKLELPGPGWTITSLVAGVVLLALFVAVESRVEHPLLPFRIFANRTRAASFVAMMLLPAAMFAMFFFLSLLIQLVVGYSPLHTGAVVASPKPSTSLSHTTVTVT